MSRKLREIPNIPNYDWIRQQMQEDLKYRLQDRQRRTSLGRPLYERINVQVILTQECPNHCPFCIERQNPMTGQNDFVAQIKALEQVLAEHPNARLSITGGEPGLYPKQVKALADCYRNHSNHTFLNINTTGYDATIRNYGHINLSVNPYVQSDLFDEYQMNSIVESYFIFDICASIIRLTISPPTRPFSREVFSAPFFRST